MGLLAVPAATVGLLGVDPAVIGQVALAVSRSLAWKVIVVVPPTPIYCGDAEMLEIAGPVVLRLNTFER